MCLFTRNRLSNYPPQNQPPYPPQYPYQPPQGIPMGYPPPQFGPNYAKRAGWLMLGLGIVILLFGGCFFGFAFLPFDQLPADQQQNFHQIESQLHMPVKTFFEIAGVLVMVVGLAHFILSFFVRGGGKGSIITAMILTGLVIGWIGLNTVFGILSGAPNAIAGACVMLIVLLVFGWQFAWLLQAVRDKKDPAALAQYQAQYWQYQQQQQMYQQPYPPGYGYPPPPPGGQGGAGGTWAYGSPPPPPPGNPPAGSTSEPTQHYPRGDQGS